MQKLMIILSLLFSVQTCLIFSIGSNTAPSRREQWHFATGGTNNIILGFVAMDNGFTFSDTKTTCSFDCFIPVSGSVALRQGRLYLFQDLIFKNDFRLNSPGWIVGNNYRVEFPSYVAENLIPAITTTASMLFDNTNVVFNTNTTFQSPMQFRKTCNILGNGHKLTMSAAKPLIVRDGTLTIKNAILDFTSDKAMYCMRGTGRIKFCDCTLLLETDYTFTQGGITFTGENVITGSNKFIYTSTVASTIDTQSVLYFDKETTFSYAPANTRHDLLFMTDASSVLYLDNASLLTTRTGIKLSTGTVLFDNRITLSSSARYINEAIIFNHNVSINMFAGAYLDAYGFIRVQ